MGAVCFAQDPERLARFNREARILLYSAHMQRASYTQLYHHRDGTETLVFDGLDDIIRNPVYCDSGHVLFRKDGESFFMLYQADEEKGNCPLMVVERWNGE